MDDRKKQIEILENFVKKINLEKRQQLQVKFTYRRCFLETLIIGINIVFLECCCFNFFSVLMLSIVPAAAIVFNVMFFKAEQAMALS